MWLRGDYIVSDVTLNRFFALHVIAMPLVLLGLVMFLPADRMERIASDQLSTQMGRQITLRNVSISIFPTLNITTNNIKITNPN